MIFSQRISNWQVTMLLAVTVGLAAAWVGEPLLVGSSWVRRLLLMAGCLTSAGAIFRLEMRRQLRNEAEVRRFFERMTQLNHHDLISENEANPLPVLEKPHGWQPTMERMRSWLVKYGERLAELEHARTGAEVRLRKLADQQIQIREIFDRLAEPILVTNHYDELVLANAAARDLFTIDAAEPRQSLGKLVPSDPLVGLVTETRRRKSPALRNSEIELTHDGEQHWFRVCCRSLSLGGSEDGDEQGVVTVLADISSEKGIQKRHAEFVAAASHEMKTPLAGIRAYVELLRDGEADDEATREEFLGVIDTQSDRLQRLIENLLNLARIEAGVVSVEKQNQSLNELLEKAFSVVQPSSEQKEIELTKDLSPMYLGVLADRDMIMQSAINLLSNAIKYTEPGGKITLRSRMEDNAVVFEVEDTGVGLSEEDGRRIFERFYRVKKDRQMASGTGLGLPLAKHIVEDVHGGTLTVTSQLGKGSVFRISLPSLGRVKV